MMTTIERPVEVETFVWMQVKKDKHTDKKYYSIGQVKDVPHTLLVTECGSNGGAIFYCLTHEEAYPFKGQCATCQNAVVETPSDSSTS
jgi:hypothetical protein